MKKSSAILLCIVLFVIIACVAAFFAGIGAPSHMTTILLFALIACTLAIFAVIGMDQGRQSRHDDDAKGSK